MRITKAQLKQGIRLDTSLNSIYSGKLTEEASKIIDIMVDYNINDAPEAPKAKLIVDTRVYEVGPNLARYYSLKGEGHYYWLNSWKQLYKFLTKPVKNGRKVKLLVEDNKKEVIN